VEPEATQAVSLLRYSKLKALRFERRAAKFIARGTDPVGHAGQAVGQAMGQAMGQAGQAVGQAVGAMGHTMGAAAHAVGHLPGAARKAIPLRKELLLKQGKRRDRTLNWQLAGPLAFVAGAVNAGGFLAVGSFTSHVTGAVSQMSLGIALKDHVVALAYFGILLCFFLGAFTSTFLISFAARRRYKSRYALTLAVEAFLLMVFGYMGHTIAQRTEFFRPGTLVMLCFVMGMHNAIVTTISNAEVRTTHMTGITTDLGIEVSRLLYWNRNPNPRLGKILGNREKLELHAIILGGFILGGIAGALGFTHIGYHATLPLAALLGLLALRPILRDLSARWRVMRQRN
jgi:uncharacterized membrane protein YoaK (UPF0700 family)